jgi:rRNA maturation RNase YbeY
MSILFFSQDISFKVAHPIAVRRWIKHITENEESDAGNINIIFCSDKYLIKINKKHLGFDYYTDIITFNYSIDNLIAGDLFISVERVKENATGFATGFNNELLRVIAHGILHLLKYDDSTPQKKQLMTSKENFYLEEWSKGIKH